MRVGLNPYGLLFTIGMLQDGERFNPTPIGFDGYLSLALEHRVGCLEIHWEHLRDRDLVALRERLEAADIEPVVSAGPTLESALEALPFLAALGGRTLRLGLSPVLCGARATLGDEWPKLVSRVRENLATLAPAAAELGLGLAIEDHQDFGSDELMQFAEAAGPNVGITLDTANPLSVAEEPLAFARRVLPRLRHVHLKDYLVQWTDEGYRLVRCATGEGYVPFAELLPLIRDRDLTVTLEIGALEARHIRLFRPEWWHFYPPRTAAELGPALAAARRGVMESSVDGRTPWEKGESGEAVLRYERAQFERSIMNLRAWGILPA
jgi:sugar phosphate isomerase/epimerase